MGTVIQYTQRRNDDRHQRWERSERADLLQPTFKGSECPYYFCAQRALHTMRDRAPAQHSTAQQVMGLHTIDLLDLLVMD